MDCCNGAFAAINASLASEAFALPAKYPNYQSLKRPVRL